MVEDPDRQPRPASAGDPQPPGPRPQDRMLLRVAERVHDPLVLGAMRLVPRHEFVPFHRREDAYADAALAIGERQTISQPLIVGIMTEALELRGGEHVLELGTGSGYQAAVLARIAGDVVTVERIAALRERARRTLQRLGVQNVRCLPAGALPGAPECAPYDGILVTAAAPEVPPALLDQLAIGGRLVIPVGSRHEQELIVVTRTPGGPRRRTLLPCRFVPLVGPGGFPDDAAPPRDRAPEG